MLIVLVPAASAGPAAATRILPSTVASSVADRGTATATADSTRRVTVGRPAATASGDVLVAALLLRSHTGVTAPSGWSLVRRDLSPGSGATLQQAVWIRVAGSSEPSGYTWTFKSSAAVVGSVSAFGGVDRAAPVAAHSGRLLQGSVTMAAPSVSAPAGATVLSFFGRNGAGLVAVSGADLRFDRVTAAGTLYSGGLAGASRDHAGGATGDVVASDLAGNRLSATVGQLVALRPAEAVVAPQPANVAPALLTAPVVSGAAQVGAQLGATSGVWSGTAPIASSFSWSRCAAAGTGCAPIAGATGASYRPVAADAGSTVRVTVVASNVAGSATATSAATALVTSAAPAVGTALRAPLPPSKGGSRYVSPAGSDAAAGTIAAPWRTLAKAVASVSPGETVYLCAGTYGDWITIDRGGTAAAPVTFRAYPGERALVTGRFKLTAGWVRVSDLVFQGGTPANATEVLVYISGADNVELSGNEFSRAAKSAMYFGDPGNGADNVQVLGNWIHDNGTHDNLDHGIYYGTGSGGLIANNVIAGNFAKGVQLYPHVDDTVVTGNTIVGNGRFGVIIGSDSAGAADRNLVVNNVIAFNAEYGVRSYWGGAVGVGNVVRGNLGYGNPRGDFGGDQGANLSFVGNVVADPRFASRSTGDYHLLASSPAIDLALADYSHPFDYDGRSRPAGGGPDIGAFERP